MLKAEALEVAGSWTSSSGTPSAIPVDRQAGAGAYAEAVRALRAGQLVGVFPEATISRSFELKEFKSGAVRMALEAQVPIVPLIVWGAQRMWTKDHPKDLGRKKIPWLVRTGTTVAAVRDARPNSMRRCGGDDRDSARGAGAVSASGRAPGGCRAGWVAGARRRRRPANSTRPKLAERARRTQRSLADAACADRHRRRRHPARPRRPGHCAHPRRRLRPPWRPVRSSCWRPVVRRAGSRRWSKNWASPRWRSAPTAR